MTVTPTPAFNPFFTRLEELAACLCAQIEADGLPPTCFCGVIPGDGVAADYAGDCATACGMAWVRLVTAYPAIGTARPDETPGNCAASMGLDIEIGILRCIEIPEDGEPLDTASLADATRFQMADAMALWRAAYCCDAIPNKDIVLSGYQPMGPLGGLVGGAYTIRTVI